MTSKHFSSPAFTLIELLVVAAIIGILASTVTVSLRAFQLKSQANQSLTDILRITEYIEAYKANYGAYPLSCGDGSGWASRDDHPAAWGCATGLGNCWIGQFSTDGWCPLPHNTNNPPAYNPTASESQYIYYSNGVNYKLIYHNAVSMGVPDEFIDPARSTFAFGTWSPGAAAW